MPQKLRLNATRSGASTPWKCIRIFAPSASSNSTTHSPQPAGRGPATSTNVATFPSAGASLEETAFHSLRHTFVTNLCKADIAPKTAQTLARHSDIRLTMNVYTHVDEKEQAAAIGRLPGVRPANDRSGCLPQTS